MKKIISAVLVLIMVLSMSIGAINAGAIGETTGEINVIFLVDSSRSMKKSDPDMIRLEAIKLFADLCTLGKTRIGFVLFGSQINYEQSPIPINTEEDREAIKKKVDELTELNGQTDIGLALKHTVENFASDGLSNKGKFIVFLSDGKTVINGNAEGRTLADSEADLEKGIEEARAAEIPIYTIGLNANGDVDEEQLRHISEKTYADSTYMTDNAGELSKILSDIFVWHTGAENKLIASYASNDTEQSTGFEISDGSVIEANLVIMHNNSLKNLRITGPDDAEIAYDGTQADKYESEGHTLVKLYTPQPGIWHIYVTSPNETQITISYILTRDFGLQVTMATDKAVGAGSKLKLEAILTDPSGVTITDQSLLTKLVGKAIIKSESAEEGQEISLVLNEEGAFTGEGVLETDENYTIQASLYNSNIDIRSEIITLENGSEEFKEPEGPWKLIIIIAAGVIVIAVIIFILLKYMKENIRMWSGRLVITANVGGVPSAPLAYDFAKKCPGKRKVILSSVIKAVSEDPMVNEAIPRSVTSATKITMTTAGDIRITKAGGVEYSGGITLGNKIALSNANRVTIRYANKSTGSTNLLIIQYLRT